MIDACMGYNSLIVPDHPRQLDHDYRRHDIDDVAATKCVSVR